MFIAPHPVVTSSPIPTPTPKTNPYANLTTLSLTDFYHIENNGTCNFPTRRECLESLLCKISTHNNPSGISSTSNSSQPIVATTAILAASSSSGWSSGGYRTSVRWVIVGILGFAFLVVAWVVLIVCTKGRRDQLQRRREFRQSRGREERNCGAGIKKKVARLFRKSENINEYDAGEARGGRMWHSLSMRKPSDQSPTGVTPTEGLPPPYIGAPAPLGRVGRRHSNAIDAGGVHMPPPIYEMAPLDARHQENLSGVPRYSWEDDLMREGW